MILYYRVQLMTNNQTIKVIPDEDDIRTQTEALINFCSVFQIRYSRHEHYPDTFYLLVPEDMLEFAHLANALNAFCFVHHSIWEIRTGKMTSTMDDFLAKIAKEKFH